MPNILADNAPGTDVSGQRRELGAGTDGNTDGAPALGFAMRFHGSREGVPILTEADLVVDIVSQLKRFGAATLEGEGGVSGIDIEPVARDLVNDLERYPHAFVLACIADRQTKSDIAWSLPLAIRKAASGFDLDTLLRLREEEWASVLASSGHRLATKMERLLPAAVRHIADRYGGDASRIWADGSSGAAVARRFLAFDGVGPKIANMAVNILIRDFHIGLPPPMPAYSDEVVHAFRAKPSGCSGPSRPPIPSQVVRVER